MAADPALTDWFSPSVLNWLPYLGWADWRHNCAGAGYILVGRRSSLILDEFLLASPVDTDRRRPCERRLFAEKSGSGEIWSVRGATSGMIVVYAIAPQPLHNEDPSADLARRLAVCCAAISLSDARGP